MQRLAEGEARLLHNMRIRMQGMHRGVDTAALSLARYPREYRDLPARIEEAARKLSAAAAAWRRWREREPEMRARGLRAAALAVLVREEARMQMAASRLVALSPLAVLARGYAIVTREGAAKPLTDSAEAEPGARLDVRLHRGRLHCEVKRTERHEGERDDHH